MQGNTEFTTLENGIRVVSETIPQHPSTALSILVDASPKDEVETQPGLAHLTEHALFLGTPQRDGPELARLIDSAGGCFGAFTAPEYTCFYAHILEDYASYALDLLGDILVASTVSADLLEREKQVIRQEIISAADSHEEILLAMTKRALWPNDVLCRSITGDENSVQSLKRQDVLTFVAQNYTPDRIIVASAGAAEHESLVEQTQDGFWTLDGSSQETSQSAPILGDGGVQVETTPSSYCSFSIAIPAPAYADSDRIALHVLNNLIGGGLSSRLYRALRENNAMVYSIQSEIIAYGRGGMLVARGSTTKENLVPCVAEVLHQITQLAFGDGVDAEELWISKRQVRSQSQLATDLVSNRVARIATQFYHFGHRIPDEQILAEIDAVTVEDVQQVSEQVLAAGLKSLCISVVGPVESDAPEIANLMDIQQQYSYLLDSKPN